MSRHIYSMATISTPLGAIQIIRDALVGGFTLVSPDYTGGGMGSSKVSHVTFLSFFEQ